MSRSADERPTWTSSVGCFEPVVVDASPLPGTMAGEGGRAVAGTGVRSRVPGSADLRVGSRYMAVSVERGLLSWWQSGSNVLLRVRSPEDPVRLRSALIAAQREIARLGRSGPGGLDGPKYLSPLIAVPGGQLLIVDFGATPRRPGCARSPEPEASPARPCRCGAPRRQRRQGAPVPRRRARRPDG